MKTLIPIALTVLMSSIATPRAQAMFGHVQAEKERRQDAEQRVTQEQQASGQLADRNARLHTTVSILSAGVVTALLVGAAVGSKARKDAQQP